MKTIHRLISYQGLEDDLTAQIEKSLADGTHKPGAVTITIRTLDLPVDLGAQGTSGNKIGENFREDILNFLSDNPGWKGQAEQISGPEARKVLTPRETFYCYLTWNGIVHWDDQILQLIQELGLPPTS